jgi:hypothetical protein
MMVLRLLAEISDNQEYRVMPFLCALQQIIHDLLPERHKYECTYPVSTSSSVKSVGGVEKSSTSQS